MSRGLFVFSGEFGKKQKNFGCGMAALCSQVIKFSNG